jgi:small subunit ribosomal protein S20
VRILVSRPVVGPGFWVEIDKNEARGVWTKPPGGLYSSIRLGGKNLPGQVRKIEMLKEQSVAEDKKDAPKKKSYAKELSKPQRRKLSPRKRDRQNETQNQRNRHRKLLVKTDVKTFVVAVAKGDAKAAEAAFKQATSRLASVATKSTIHKKTASRKRSRMAKKLNALKAGAGKKA